MAAPFIEEVRFSNFKALKNAVLPLSKFTLLIGPNGAGKSTALQGLSLLKSNTNTVQGDAISLGSAQGGSVRLEVAWGDPYRGVVTKKTFARSGESCKVKRKVDRSRAGPDVLGREAQVTEEPRLFEQRLDKVSIYSLDASAIAQPAPLEPGVQLGNNGQGLVVVLDRLRDEYPERFEALNDGMRHWFPEFDRILFETPGRGIRAVALRTAEGKQRIKAAALSHGTLIGLALLTLAYLPDPPLLIGLEEPDRGLHPRLLRDVRDALYRLCYPESVGETRTPVQVVATTHSPYFLDLYRDHPEEVMIAEKKGHFAEFSRLSDRRDIDAILGDSSLGEVWFTGILGGVPART